MCVIKYSASIIYWHACTDHSFFTLNLHGISRCRLIPYRWKCGDGKGCVRRVTARQRPVTADGIRAAVAAVPTRGPLQRMQYLLAYVIERCFKASFGMVTNVELWL